MSLAKERKKIKIMCYTIIGLKLSKLKFEEQVSKIKNL